MLGDVDRAPGAAIAVLLVACIIFCFALFYSSSLRIVERRLRGGSVGLSFNTIVATVVGMAAESGGVCPREGSLCLESNAARVLELSGVSTFCSGRCVDNDESCECTNANC